MISCGILKLRVWPYILKFSWILLAVFIMAATFSTAIEKKMHQQIPEPFGQYRQYIAIAISNLQYGLKGYVGYKRVFDVLRKNGFVNENMMNSLLLNNAIHQALTVQAPVSELVFVPNNDIGAIDYCRLSFALFGYKVESLLYLYFLLLFVQVLIFAIEFRKNKLAIAGVILFLLSHYCIVQGVAGVGANLSTVHNYRFLPVLGILPLAHICLLQLLRKPIGVRVFFRFIIQASILLFILQMRSSAIWMIGVFGISFAIAALSLWKDRFNLSVFRGLVLGRIGVSWRIILKLWPGMVLLMGMLILSLVKPHIFHEGYYGSSNSGGHTVWHNVFLGMLIDPEIRKVFGDPIVLESLPPSKYSRLGSSNWRERCRAQDADGYSAAFKWLAENGMPENTLFNFNPDEKVDLTCFFWFRDKSRSGRLWQGENPGPGFRKFDPDPEFKWRRYDQIIGKVVKRVVVTYPFRVAMATFIMKPVLFLYDFVRYFVMAQNLFSVIIALGTLAYLVFYLRGACFPDLKILLAIVVGMTIFSMAPILIAYPAPYCISEQSLLLITCFFILVIYIGKKAFQRINPLSC